MLLRGSATKAGMAREERLSALSARELAADHRRWRERYGSLGAASPCRRINPKTGKVIEIIERQSDSETKPARELARI